VNSLNAAALAAKTELLKIVRDHTWFASANPERVAAVAAQMGISPQSATAYMIVEQIDEEFHFTPKG